MVYPAEQIHKANIKLNTYNISGREWEQNARCSIEINSTWPARLTVDVMLVQINSLLVPSDVL